MAKGLHKSKLEQRKDKKKRIKVGRKIYMCMYK